MKVKPSVVIFFVAMLPLLGAYYPLKDALSPWVFVGTAFVYLFAVRVLSDFLAVKYFSRHESDDDQIDGKGERD